MASFWSLSLEPGKHYQKAVDRCIQVTRATLDTTGAKDSDEGIVRVVLSHEGKKLTVANLSMKHGVFQTQLDLAFEVGDTISFTTTGATLPVTLTGITGMADSDDEDDDESEEELDENMLDSTAEEEIQQPGIKRKLNVADKFKRPTKAAKTSDGSKLTLSGQSFVSEDESDDESYNPQPDLEAVEHDELNLLGDDVTLDDDDMENSLEEVSDGEDEDEEDEEGDENVEEEEEEEDGDEDDEDDDEAMEEEIPELTKIQKQKSKQMNGHFEKKLDVKSPKAAVVQAPKASKQEKVKVVKDAKVTATKEEKTIKDGKSKDGKTPKKEGKAGKETVKSPKADKENIEKTPLQDKKKNKEARKSISGKASGDSVQKTPKQMRAGGVMVEDVTVGTGNDAKSGNMVSVYYEGRLKSNNKLFDKQLSGPPFKFRLGRGEVIKGWDVGVAGMKVGGKRMISVPPSMGYGKKGAQPEIPPNAFLNFEVTLVSTH